MIFFLNIFFTSTTFKYFFLPLTIYEYLGISEDLPGNNQSVMIPKKRCVRSIKNFKVQYSQHTDIYTY